jgi:hypothetical protein
MVNKFLTILLVIANVSVAYGQQCDKGYISYDEKSVEIGFGIGEEHSFEETVSQIQNLSNSQLTQLWMIAGWFFENMSFDLNKFLTGGPVDEFETIFQRKKGICGEYARLFSGFCDELGIKNYVIEGYAPELSNNTLFVETNHAWNVVEISDCWYHCDLQGFSGKLHKSQDGNLSFRKEADPFSFLARDDFFLSKHIPADPMWQLKIHPQEMEMLLSMTHIILHGSSEFNYSDSIRQFESLSDSEKNIKFAQNAHKYNPNNHNVVVINYYNEAVDLINSAKGDRRKMVLAEQYLSEASKHVHFASNGVQELSLNIEKALEYIKKNLR